MIYPTAIGWESSDTDDEKSRQLNAWIISQRGHAVANGLPVISVNRVGHEPDPSMQTNGILFWGNSFVVGPQGEFWRRLVMISLRILWWKLIWNVRRMSVVGGHSCVIAGLTPMKD